jgi:antibiotic biosynthesis monooxygenase (ABM) superfamily enzyme
LDTIISPAGQDLVKIDRTDRTFHEPVTGLPVTVVVTRVVRPSKVDEFARWADKVDSAAARFDGHPGGVRLHDAQGMNHLIYQFDSQEHLKAWEASPRRR